MFRSANPGGTGIYHVACLVGPARPLFTDVADYVDFEMVAARTLEQYSIATHAFCWQATSVHMLVQSDRRSVTRFIRSTFSYYARNYSQRVPTLPFDDTRCLQLIDSGSLLATVKQVHRLPFPDSIEQIPRDFPWTSHRAYLRETPLPWLTTELVLGQFSISREVALVRYEKFMRHRRRTEPSELNRASGF